MAKQTFTSGQVLTAAQVNALQANDYNQTVSNKTANYTLVAADKGTRIVMNNAGATTITVNTGLFDAGDTLFIQNIGAGTCTITAGTATVTTAGSLALAQWGGGTLYFTSASAAIFFSGGGIGYGVATGGTSSSITVSSEAYTLLTFTSDTNLVVSKGGLFDVLAIGGGGGAGRSDQSNRGGGGGGGGDVVGLDKILTVYLNAGTYAVDVGSAGVGGAYAGGAGGKTTLDVSMVVSNGGGGGVSCDNAISGAAQRTVRTAGGSGGGYAYNDFQFVSQGTKVNNGGIGPVNISTAPSSAGGGGGAGSAGGAASGTNGGAGGNGTDIQSWIGAGSATYVSSGGGGGGTGAGGAAGLGGRAGTNNGTAITPPTTYGSGGAGGTLFAGSAGFQGVMYVRFKV